MQRLVRTYPQFSTTAADRDGGDFQTRAVVDRAQLVGYEYVDDYPWLQDAEKAGHEVVEKLKAKPVVAGPLRHRASIRRSCSSPSTNPSATRPSSIARSAGKPNMAGTSFIKADRRRQAALRRQRSSTWSATARRPAGSPRRVSTTKA